MSDYKHTPAPWIAKGKGGFLSGGSTMMHPCFDGHIKSANGQTIIQTSSLIGVQGKTPAEAEANARLIAAAPSLLTALINLLEHREGTEEGNAARKEAELLIQKIRE
jgi:hypothetical protein